MTGRLYISIMGELHRQGTPPKKATASSDDASFFETEIAAATWSGRADDHMIDEIELEDSAGFEHSAGQPQIGFGRGGITAGWL